MNEYKIRTIVDGKNDFTESTITLTPRSMLVLSVPTVQKESLLRMHAVLVNAILHNKHIILEKGQKLQVLDINDMATDWLNCGNCEHYKETFLQGWCSCWGSTQTAISSRRYKCDKHKLKGEKKMNGAGYQPDGANKEEAFNFPKGGTGCGGPVLTKLTKAERVDAQLRKLDLLIAIGKETTMERIEHTLNMIDKELEAE